MAMAIKVGISMPDPSPAMPPPIIAMVEVWARPRTEKPAPISTQSRANSRASPNRWRMKPVEAAPGTPAITPTIITCDLATGPITPMADSRKPIWIESR